MCLALPVRIETVEAGVARATLGSTSQRLSQVHAGFAIQRLSPQDAMETWDALASCATGLPPRPSA